MKRDRDEEDVHHDNQLPKKQKSTNSPLPNDITDDDEDDKPLLPNFKQTRNVRQGHECPYLATISRHNLDFDFEKCCSVSLSHVNVYACLVCGKYFQGRAPGTHAHTHSLESGHHLYMKLENGKVFCLPDQYEVLDSSLSDIQYVLNPTYAKEELDKGGLLETQAPWASALDGTDYMPGMVGLNDIRENDYVNVVVQVLNTIAPIRNYFLRTDNNRSSNSGTKLTKTWGELLRKMWNPKAFKGHVSPHEFMQAVSIASNKRFTTEKKGDPVEFMLWLVNQLHLDLTGGKRKRPSIITECLQGELEVVTEAGTGTGRAKESAVDMKEKVPFLTLGLDLPPAPLFKDAKMEKITIPQVPIFDLLRKYNGQLVTDDIKGGRRIFTVTKLPQYLVLHVKRFLKNQFFLEKNPTIVNFPVKNLDLGACIPLPGSLSDTHNNSKGKKIVGKKGKYDLVANIVHEGIAGEGMFKMYAYRGVEGLWYEIQDLRVTEVLPQMVALSEMYLQVWKSQ
jgi:U4/U6.U5 tri-snRNP-associated protein 2